MLSAFPHQIGILPSLEILPFYEEGFQSVAGTSFVPRSSYGGIARDMLTGTLGGGILPWEIFTADVLALPGQRTLWRTPLFPHACPTELALQPTIHRGLHPAKSSSPRKLPSRLVIGVESRNSLTKNQLHEWLAGLGSIPRPEVIFKFLPIDLMPQAMAADAIDGFIAAAPWGLIAEEMQLGVLDRNFKSGKFAQQLVIACRKTEPASGFAVMQDVLGELKTARTRLADPAGFRNAAARMAQAGKPVIGLESLEHAARHHASRMTPHDILPDLAKLTRELHHLESLSILPPQIAAGDQTAKLLLPP